MAKPKRRTEIEFPGAAGQSLGADDVGPGPGQNALGRRRITTEEPVRHDQAQHRVTQKLQPLVVLLQAPFVGEGAVGQGLIKQRPVLEPVTETRFESLDRIGQG